MWNLFSFLKKKRTEREKAAAGLLYDANHDSDLLDERLACQEMCYEYNRLSPVQEEERCALLKKILGKTGEKLVILQPFYCDYGMNIEIGENFYANYHCTMLDAAKIIFGENVFIGPNCSFYTAGHPLDAEQRRHGLEYAKSIEVGNNVWIGGNVVVLPGVHIGNNSVIGAGSIVSKDIPANVVAAGNPCLVLRSISKLDTMK